MNSFPSCFRRGQGVVNPRIVDRRWGCSLTSRLRGSTTAWEKSCAIGMGGFLVVPTGKGFMRVRLKKG
jgi:hypothetical protein